MVDGGGFQVGVFEERRMDEWKLGHLTHGLVENKEIHFRPFGPHKSSRDRDSLPLHVQKMDAPKHPRCCPRIKGDYAPHRPITRGRSKMGVHPWNH